MSRSLAYESEEEKVGSMKELEQKRLTKGGECYERYWNSSLVILGMQESARDSNLIL